MRLLLSSFVRPLEGLVGFGILEGEVDDIIEAEAYRAFCPHKTSHWLGLDVHDVGDYRLDGHWRDLEPGMVMTIEPGIYIPDDEQSAGVEERWRGLGVRIEDDVLITADGHEVLTNAPKERAEIEACMAAG